METEEIWKDIEGYEGVYRVSNKGNVWSVRRNMLLKPEVTKLGYTRVMLWLNKGSKVYIHRLVAQTFIANLANLSEVNHIDEDKLNNCVENLEWCTREYNNNYRTANSKLRGVVSPMDHGVIGTHKITGDQLFFKNKQELQAAGFTNAGLVVGKYGRKGNRSTLYGYIWDLVSPM